jgi:hypothetical protein
MSNRALGHSLKCALPTALLACWPLVANAQPGPVNEVTAEQVRSQFVNAGFQAETPTHWWTPDSATTFRVIDPNSDRVLMVLVYPNSDVANAARTVLEQEEARGANLVPGYGLSTWRQNIALVESTQTRLRLEYAAELQRNTHVLLGDSVTVQSLAPLTTAVDADLVGLVEGTAVNL